MVGGEAVERLFLGCRDGLIWAQNIIKGYVNLTA